MTDSEKYIQLKSWDELVEWLEREGAKVIPVDNWNPKPKRRNKKTPPQSEGLF